MSKTLLPPFKRDRIILLIDELLCHYRGNGSVDTLEVGVILFYKPERVGKKCDRIASNGLYLVD